MTTCTLAWHCTTQTSMTTCMIAWLRTMRTLLNTSTERHAQFSYSSWSHPHIWFKFESCTSFHLHSHPCVRSPRFDLLLLLPSLLAVPFPFTLSSPTRSSWPKPVQLPLRRVWTPTTSSPSPRTSHTTLHAHITTTTHTLHTRMLGYAHNRQPTVILRRKSSMLGHVHRGQPWSYTRSKNCNICNVCFFMRVYCFGIKKSVIFVILVRIFFLI